MSPEEGDLEYLIVGSQGEGESTILWTVCLALFAIVFSLVDAGSCTGDTCFAVGATPLFRTLR